MMLVYDRHYRDEKRALEIDIEEFLTQNEASGIYTVEPGKYSRTLCAVNYGSDDVNIRRGIQEGNLSGILMSKKEP